MQFISIDHGNHTDLWYAVSTISLIAHMDLLPDTYNCGLRMHREYRERFPFSRHRLKRESLVNDPSMRVAIANRWWQGKRSRHSRRMRHPQFYVSDKRPMLPDQEVINNNGITVTRYTESWILMHAVYPSRYVQGFIVLCWTVVIAGVPCG